VFLLVPAHLGFPGQIPQSRKTVVCVCVCEIVFHHRCHQDDSGFIVIVTQKLKQMHSQISVRQQAHDFKL